MSLERIRPILLRKNPPRLSLGDWLYEIRFDGWRAMLYIEPGNAYFISRRGKTLHQFANLAGQIADELKVTWAIFDGIITLFDPATHYSYGSPNMRGEQVYFLAFDLLRHNAKDMQPVGLIFRKMDLKHLLKGQIRIQYVPHLPRMTPALEKKIHSRNLKGYVARRRLDPYRRSSRWYEVLNQKYFRRNSRLTKLQR